MNSQKGQKFRSGIHISFIFSWLKLTLLSSNVRFKELLCARSIMAEFWMLDINLDTIYEIYSQKNLIYLNYSWNL